MYQEDNNDLSFPLKRVDEVHPEASTGGEESSSKAPVVAGVIVALLVLICAVVAAWLYLRRRNNKRCVLFLLQQNLLILFTIFNNFFSPVQTCGIVTVRLHRQYSLIIVVKVECKLVLQIL